MDPTVGALLVVGATFVMLGAYLYSPKPIVLRSTFYLLPFSLVFLVLLFRPALFEGKLEQAYEPLIVIGFFAWVLLLLVWDNLLGDLHAVNVDRYGLLDAVRETLQRRKLTFSFEPGEEGMVRVMRFSVPTIEGIVRVAYYAPLRLAVVRFTRTGVRRFEPAVERDITEAIRGGPPAGRTSFAALNIVVGACLLLVAVGLFAA
jgi:hypothetical protein